MNVTQDISILSLITNASVLVQAVLDVKKNGGDSCGLAVEYVDRFWDRFYKIKPRTPSTFRCDEVVVYLRYSKIASFLNSPEFATASADELRAFFKKAFVPELNAHNTDDNLSDDNDY